MADKYVYNKYETYRTCDSYGRYEEESWEKVSFNYNEIPPIIFKYNNYDFDPFDGTFSIIDRGSNLEWINESNRYGRFFYLEGGKLYKDEYEYVNESAVLTTTFRKGSKFVETGETCRDAKGKLVESFVADAGEYPINGVLGGYWYEMVGKVSEAKFTGIEQGEYYHTYVRFNVVYPRVPDVLEVERVIVEISLDNQRTWKLVEDRDAGGTSATFLLEPEKYGISREAYLRATFVMKYGSLEPAIFGSFFNLGNKKPKPVDFELPKGRYYSVGDSVLFKWRFTDEDGDSQVMFMTELQSFGDKSDRHSSGKVFSKEEEHSMTITEDYYLNYKYDAFITVGDEYHEYGFAGIGTTSISGIYILDKKLNVKYLMSGEYDSSKLIVPIEPDFKTGDGVARLYSEDGKILEEIEVPAGATELSFEYTLENLTFYQVGYRPTLHESEPYGGLDANEFKHNFQTIFEPPKKPTLEYVIEETGISLIPKATEGEPETVRLGIQKLVNNKWVTLTDDFKTFYVDRLAKSGVNTYRAVAYSSEGSFAYSENVNVEFTLKEPVLTNLRTLEEMRIRDVIKTDITYKPDLEYFKILSSSSLRAETGEYVERNLSLEWEIYNVSDLNAYKDFIRYGDVYLYRDGEGRSLQVVIYEVKEREAYNPHWFYLSLEAKEVAS